LEAFNLIAELGLPIAGALIMAYFIFLVMKQLMDGLISEIQTVQGITKMLITRASIMNNDMIRIDTSVSSALNLPPDLDRIARVVMVVGLGYFVYFVWQTITNKIDPSVQEMKATIIRLTDQLRLLDQDMIRLQQKVNTVLEMRENEGSNETAEPKNKKQEGIRRVD
jgi:prefoldin subunit 5